MPMIFFDSHDVKFRDPTGPVTPSTPVTFRIIAEEAQQVFLRIFTDEELFFPMVMVGENLWQTTIMVPDHPGLVWYDFTIFMQNAHKLRYGNSSSCLGGQGKVYNSGEDFHSYQITVYSQDFHTPSFMHGANIYQIFPDRFFKGKTASVDTRTDRIIHDNWDEDVLTSQDPRSGDNMAIDFFGGNLAGIKEKLPYLHDLGVTALYLNPIFKARSNHRYDTGDYSHVDPLLGTDDELTELCEAAKSCGISIILDGVFSHTGEDSIYFNRSGNYDNIGAYQSKDSPYFSWFTFRSFPDDYRCWWNIPSLPECRKDSKSYGDFILNNETGIVPKWLKAGISGWRLDVADELPMCFLRKLRRAAKNVNPDALVLGEVWEDASNKISYGELRCYCTGDTLDSVMNYPLREAVISFIMGNSSAKDLALLINHQSEVYPTEFRYALMNLLGSHDRARALNVLCGKDGVGLSKSEQKQLKLTPAEYMLATERYKKCFDILCALPGCVTVYYGDEAGMTGCPDPFCRRPYIWGNEDRNLQQYIKNKLNHRRNSDCLRRGFCNVFAADDDTIVINRFLTDKDAFGGNASPVQEIVTVKR